MRACLLILLAACWRDAPAPREPQAEADEQAPPPATRLVRDQPPRPTDRFGEAMLQLEGFADQMCQCADSTCAYQVVNDMTKWSEEQGKDPEFRNMKPTPDQIHEAQEASRRLTDCMTNALGSGSAGTMPSP
jgi:hypothetical protein